MAAEKKIPEIRFKGFEGEWEEKKLGEIVDFSRGKLVSWSDIVEDGKYKCVLYGNLYTDYGMVINDIIYSTNINSKELVHSKFGDVLIPCSDTTPTGLARASCIEISDVILGGDINILRPIKTLNGSFLSYNINYNRKKLIQLIKGSTVRHLDNTDLKSVEIFISKNLKEQVKLSEIFKNLDSLISLHQRKYDKLLTVKKAMLEKMFPKEGADVPEIRFKGFTEEWEAKRFGDCVLIQRGGSPRPIENFITNKNNGINWIKIGDVSIDSRYITKTKEKIIPEGEKHSRKVQKGDLILSNSMSFGRPYIMAIDGCIHDGWLLIRDEKKMFDLEFLLQLLSSDYMLKQYRALASGGVVINLNSELVQSTKVYIPNKNEQHKIGQFFSNLDTLITQHQKELEKLKNVKNACLEKMFV